MADLGATVAQHLSLDLNDVNGRSVLEEVMGGRS
jgi:hypothetical protein